MKNDAMCTAAEKEQAGPLGQIGGENALLLPRFLSVKRAAEYTSLSEATIRRLLGGGKLTSLRPCKGKILIDRHQLDAVVVSSTAMPRTGRGIRTGTNTR